MPAFSRKSWAGNQINLLFEIGPSGLLTDKVIISLGSVFKLAKTTSLVSGLISTRLCLRLTWIPRSLQILLMTAAYLGAPNIAPKGEKYETVALSRLLCCVLRNQQKAVNLMTEPD